MAYDVLGELNAGNFLARRSLEDMQATEGQYWGHGVMLKAATDGVTPSEGPLNRMFKIGKREIPIREQYITEQSSQMCGRLEAKLGQLHERHWNLMGRGLQEAADVVEKEMEKYHELLYRVRRHEERSSRQTTNRSVTNLWEPSSLEIQRTVEKTRIQWKKMDCACKVSSKKHLIVSHRQEGVRNIFQICQKRCA